MFVLNIV